jgi:hypothetical protein
MKHTYSLLAALVVAIAIPAHAEETTLIAYPTVEQASFTIEVPDSWEMTAAEDDGDFFHLDGPTGAIFSFRTIEGSEDVLKEAIDDTMSHIGGLFTEIEIGDAQDWTPGGLTGFYATGSGKDKDGSEVRIGVAWCALNDGKLAQMWFVADADDAAGMKAAESIANSLASPE